MSKRTMSSEDVRAWLRRLRWYDVVALLSVPIALEFNTLGEGFSRETRTAALITGVVVSLGFPPLARRTFDRPS